MPTTTYIWRLQAKMEVELKVIKLKKQLIKAEDDRVLAQSELDDMLEFSKGLTKAMVARELLESQVEQLNSYVNNMVADFKEWEAERKLKE